MRAKHLVPSVYGIQQGYGTQQSYGTQQVYGVHPIRGPLCRLLLCWLCCLITVGWPNSTRGDDGIATDVQQEEIEQLIENLADPKYSVRVRARQELERLGLLALDAIRRAEESSNVEIAFAARSIMSRLRVQWTDDKDASEVRQILEGYNDLNPIERRSRMDRLTRVADHQGLPALIRLARFEQSLQLSRQAAILAMHGNAIDNPISEELRDRLEQQLGDSQRDAADWLRQWLSDLQQNQFSPDAWRSLLDAERQLVDNNSGNNHTTSVILLDLYRVCATHALAMGRREDALSLAMDSLDKVMSRRQDLLNAVTWALDQRLCELVLRLEQRDPKRFASEPELMYAVAEAHSIQENQELAQQASQAALETENLPELNAEGELTLAAERVRQIAMRRREIARVLETRGLFAWAEAEYRRVIERTPLASVESASHRFVLAELLGLFNRHQEIVDLLTPLAERLEKDAGFRNVSQKEAMVFANVVLSKRYYHQALASEGEEARQALRQSLNKRRDDPDVLIAMHRQQGDQAWRQEVANEVQNVVKLYLNEIRREEQSLKGEPSSEITRARVAEQCNNYAWLVANTDGDLASALQMSNRSNELIPDNASFLDTLALCYFKRQDVAQAIALQRQAVKLSPHSPPLKRQLEFYLQQQSEAGAE